VVSEAGKLQKIYQMNETKLILNQAQEGCRDSRTYHRSLRR
jgi:hypothetical protein